MRITLAVLALSLLLPLGCGGSGGGTPNLSGWYEFARRPAGSGAVYRATSIAELEDAGESLWWAGVELVWTGDAYFHAQPDTTSPDRLERRLWRVNDDHFEGLYDQYVGGTPTQSEVRLLPRGAPNGTLRATGTFDALPVAFDSANAYGAHVVEAASYVLVVCAFHARSRTVVQMIFPVPVPIPAGPYSVPLAEVSVIGVVDDTSVPADAGTVTIVHSDLQHASGTYDVGFPGGENLQGEFDVPLLVDL